MGKQKTYFRDRESKSGPSFSLQYIIAIVRPGFDSYLCYKKQHLEKKKLFFVKWGHLFLRSSIGFE